MSQKGPKSDTNCQTEFELIQVDARGGGTGSYLNIRTPKTFLTL